MTANVVHKVVVSGIGFVHPAGVGSTFQKMGNQNEIESGEENTLHSVSLGGNKQLFHYENKEVSNHPHYPDRKKARSMRPDAIYAYVAAAIAMDNAGLSQWDHTNTGMMCAGGQCYGDMWPYIKRGLEASTSNDVFQIDTFGKQGHKKMYPFFSVRALSALPMAFIAERFGLHGENAIISSFGAESVTTVRQAYNAVSCGAADAMIVGGFDYLGNPHEVENMYFNDFYQGDFYGISGSCFLILESHQHARERNHKPLGTLEFCQQAEYTVGADNQIHWPAQPFSSACHSVDATRVSSIHVSPSGTESNYLVEKNAAATLFPHASLLNDISPFGSMLAASEPFGIARLLGALPFGETGVSLSRSVCGCEGAVGVTRLAPTVDNERGHHE